MIRFNLLSIGLVLLIVMAGFLPSCAQSQSVDAERLALAQLVRATGGGKGLPWCFRVSPDPILQSGQLEDGATWNDPSVLYDAPARQFVMYLSADHKFDQNIQIWRMISVDGTHWALAPHHPVLSATSGAWDRKAIETPSVVQFKGQYYMFYTAYGTNLRDFLDYKIGYAVSSDGINWTKVNGPLVQPTAPRAIPNFDFHQYIVAEPGAVVVNDRLIVYFTAVGADRDLQTTLQTIGMIESEDGVNWTAPVQVLKPDQTVYPRTKNIKGFSSPGAAVIRGRVHLFTSVATDEPYVQIALHHAVSPDGRVGWFQDRAPFLEGKNYPWLQDSVTSPTVLMVGDVVHFWFSGHAGYTLSLGHGICVE
jgi:predicted GH43/DUF377 family glycosyl hydrolase